MDSRSSRRSALALLLCAVALPARADFWSEAKKKAAQAAKDAAKGKPAEPAPKATPAASPAPQPAAAARPGGKAPVEPLVVPEESQAVIDVLGIQVGRSTPDEVRAVLASRAGSGPVREVKGSPDKAGLSGEQEVKALAGADWISMLSGATPLNAAPHEGINVVFPAPPNPIRALSLNRRIAFTAEQGSAPEQVEASLAQKYGAPRPTGWGGGPLMNPNARRLVWAWGFDGRPLSLAEAHPALQFPSGNVEQMLREGAAAVLVVELTIQNGIVTAMTTTATDIHGRYITQKRTRAWAAAEVEARLKREREAAAKRGGPAL